MNKDILERTARFLLITVIIFISTPCTALENSLEVFEIPEGSIIKNLFYKIVYYIIHPNSILPFIEWAPCTPTDDWCEELQPEEEILFSGSEPSTVFWWEIHEQEDVSSVQGEVNWLGLEVTKGRF